VAGKDFKNEDMVVFVYKFKVYVNKNAGIFTLCNFKHIPKAKKAVK
jgi:hypothetical protein